MQFLKKTHIHFISQRKVAAMISGALILISIISLVLHGGPRYGIDFTGGVQLRYHFEQNIDEGNIRDAIINGGIENPTIKKFSTRSGQGTDILIFVQQQDGKTEAVVDGSVQIQKSAADMSSEIHSILESAFADQKFEEIQKNMVGPKIGGELRSAAILAILASLLLILIYISWRFEFRFAVGAIVALFHDVVITLGIFSLLNLEITLSIIAAFLTIVGYSLNDTIVVFDRVRENMKIMRRDSFDSILDHSINQSLGRTVVTSVTTLFVVVTLYLLGGEVIQDFAFAMMVGVLIGTYSSIYVASPVVYAMQSKGRNQTAKK